MHCVGTSIIVRHWLLLAALLVTSSNTLPCRHGKLPSASHVSKAHARSRQLLEEKEESLHQRCTFFATSSRVTNQLQQRSPLPALMELPSHVVCPLCHRVIFSLPESVVNLQLTAEKE